MIVNVSVFYVSELFTVPRKPLKLVYSEYTNLSMWILEHIHQMRDRILDDVFKRFYTPLLITCILSESATHHTGLAP
jgi:hypothetical protein